MSNFIVEDEIDFSAYMDATDHDHKVVPSGAFSEDVVDYFHNPSRPRGALMPWPKAAGLVRFREGEVTLWSGMNGHGKSLVLGQACMSLIAQQQRVCIASLEMKPVVTLARMYRQALQSTKPPADEIRDLNEITADWLWIYDQQGQVRADKMLAVMRYCADQRGIQHFVLDSLMKCGLAEDDFTAQKQFIDGLCTIARDTGMHVHLVVHSRKSKDELNPPGKMDVKGSGAITDQVDNVLTVWRNKAKERARDEGTSIYDPHDPDALLICDKQRNGEWEGRLRLWFDPESLQFVESYHLNTLNLMAPPR